MKPRTLLLYLFALSNFAHIVDFMILMPLGDVLMKDFAIPPQKFTYLVSAYAVSAFFAGIFGVFFIDRFDRKKALLAVMFGFGLGTIACSFAPSYEFFLLARTLTGFFGGIIGALVLAVISDLYPFEERGKAMGIVSTSFSLASVLGVPLGLILADSYNWQLPFLLLGGFVFVMAFLILKLMPAMDAHLKDANLEKENKLQQLFSILGNANLRKALALTILMIMGHFSIIPFISPYMIRNVGLLQQDIKYIYLFGGLATVVSAPLAGRWVDKFGAARVFLIALLSSFAVIAVLTNLSPVPLWTALVVTTLFFIATNSRFVPAQTLITSSVEPSRRGSFMSLNASAQQLASGSASLLGGWIVSEAATGQIQHYPILGMVAIGISACTLFVVFSLKIVK
ncbi:MFS transporter [Hugenholtzia roseola]|uniref:MFS transporter n=1 Tax=Hugenholtzia roseola TaxID=1002 RepID=UPI00041617B6|nr:MFS transporter [Hugenholtzia roseola]